MPQLFINYRRGDEPLAADLVYKCLVEHFGHENVFYDHEKAALGRDWREPLLDWVRESDALVALIGPRWLEMLWERAENPEKVDYVLREIDTALDEGKKVVPVLVSGAAMPTADQLPDPLKQLATFGYAELKSPPDFDADLRRLVNRLEEEVGRGLRACVRHGVPELPKHFLPRPVELQPVKDLLLSETHQPLGITSCLRVGMHGMGGVGKSVLAMSLAWDEEDIPNAFPDGVYWITVGQLSESDLRLRQEQLAQALGGKPVSFNTWHQGQAEIGQLLVDKQCLIILDDIWEVWQAQAFGIPDRGCRVLITTRDSEVLQQLDATEHSLDLLPIDQSLELLKRWSGVSREQMPIGVATDLAVECGRLPVALAMAGAMVGAGDPPRWASVLQKFREADLSEIRQHFPNYPYPDLLKALQVSVDALQDAADERGWQWDLATMYLDLAVFPEDTPIPESACARLWAHLGLSFEDTQDVLKYLADRSLLQRDMRQHVHLHDTQYDYVRYQLRQCGPEALCAVHERLLQGYLGLCVNGWASGPDDGYFFSHLATHLVYAGRGEELCALLFDFDWLQTKLECCGPGALLTDFALPLGSRLPSNPTSPIEPLGLELVRNAIRIASHILASDRTQLAAQLTGRTCESMKDLPEDEAAQIAGLLESACGYSGTPWLRPLNESLKLPEDGLMYTLLRHTSRVCAVAVAETVEGTRAISASVDGMLQVWDLKTGTVVRTLEGHASSVTALAVTYDGTLAFSGYKDGRVMLWHVKSGHFVNRWDGHTNWVSAVAVTPDGRYGISGSDDGTLKVWDLQGGSPPRALGGHTLTVTSVAVTADGCYAISGSADKTVKVWDLRGGGVRTLEGHAGFVRTVAVTPDGRNAISGSDDCSCTGENTLILWDLVGDRPPRMLEGHNDSVISVAMTADSRYAISGSDDGTLKWWDFQKGGPPRTLRAHGPPVTAVVVTPDGRHAVSLSSDNALQVWDLQAADGPGRTTLGHSLPVSAVVVTPDSRYAISGSYGETLKVWDLQGSGPPRTLEGKTNSATALAVTADGRYVISGSNDWTVKVWDLQAGGGPRTLGAHSGLVTAVAVTADGRYVISGSTDLTVRVWDLRVGRLRRKEKMRKLERWLVHTMLGHNGIVRAVAVTPDGQYGISGSDDKTLILWDLQRGDPLETFECHSNSVTAVATTPDGRYAISGSDDKNLILWDLQGGSPPRPMDGHNNSVTSVAVTPDGRYAISSSRDKTLRVTDLKTGKLVTTFVGDSSIRCITIAPDGQTVIAGDESGAVHFLRPTAFPEDMPTNVPVR